MPAEAREVLGADAERGVQVEGRDRPPGPLPVAVGSGDQDDRPVEALDEPRGDDPDHALVPVLVCNDVAAPTLAALGPRLDLGNSLADDPVLDRLPLAVQLLEAAGELGGLRVVLGEEELQRRLGMREPPGCVDPRRQTESDSAGVDGGRVDSGRAHQRTQPELLRPRQRFQPGPREVPVLVHERDDVGDRRDRDEIEVPPQLLRPRAEERLTELVDDPGSAELREWIVGRPRRDDRAVRQLVSRPVVVGDDDVEPQLFRAGHLGDRGDPAVHGDDEGAPVAGQSVERLAGDAVALLEPAREVPGDVCAELPQDEHGERRGADPVRVVVAVDTDALS